MKEKLKPISQAFVKNAIGLDGIINALSRTTTPEPPDPPTPPIPPGPDTLPEYQYYGLFSVGSHEITNPSDGTGTGVDCTTDKVLLGFNVYSSDEWSTALEPVILKKSHCYEIDFLTLPANKDLDYDNEEIESEGMNPRLMSIFGWSSVKMHTGWEFGSNNNEIYMNESGGEMGDSNFPSYPEFEQLTREQAVAIYESMQ